MTQPDYYAILGVEPTATPSDIKAAYRQKMRDVHPDALIDMDDDVKTDAEAEVRLVNEAYQVLSNEEKRATYDQQLIIPPADGQPFRVKYQRPPDGLDKTTQRILIGILIIFFLIAMVPVVNLAVNGAGSNTRQTPSPIIATPSTPPDN